MPIGTWLFLDWVVQAINIQLSLSANVLVWHLIGNIQWLEYIKYQMSRQSIYWSEIYSATFQDEDIVELGWLSFREQEYQSETDKLHSEVLVISDL